MIYIGIDTGVNTGYAVWDSAAHRFTDIRTLKIHEAMDAVLAIREDKTVVFEDARKRKWFGNDKGRNQLQGAGSIKRDGKIWEDFLKDKGVEFVMKAPAAGMTKWDADYFNRVTGWKGRTSKHARDAAMLVFGR